MPKFSHLLASCFLLFGCAHPAPYKGIGELKSGASEGLQSPSYLRVRSDLELDWPVDRARLTQKYHQGHWGVDLAGPRGTEILAAHDGTVAYVGNDFSGYGRLIILENGKEWASFYAHLEEVFVSEGEKISKGHLLASMGDSGRASGVHLHFELRQFEKPVDPLGYLP